MPFDNSGNLTLDPDLVAQAPIQLAYPLANLAAPGAIGGTTPAAGAFTTGAFSGAVNIDGATDIDSTLDVSGAVILQSTVAAGDAITLATNKKLLLRDSALSVSSTVDGQLDLAADVELQIDTLTLDINASTLTDISGPLTVGGVITASLGIKETAQSLTPDAVSGAAATITAGVTNVAVGAVTNDANDWIVLPAIANVPIGHTINISCNAGTNFELRTPAASNTKINDVDADGGAAEYLCTDTELIVVTKHTTTSWVARAYSKLGAAVAAVVPHAV